MIIDHPSGLYRGDYFRLRILCLEERRCQLEDIKGIVASQPDLRLLGFYRLSKIYKPLLTIAQKIHRDPSRLHPLPTIFMLDCYEDRVVELLPSYQRPGEALEAFREIDTCFGLNYTSPIMSSNLISSEYLIKISIC